MAPRVLPRERHHTRLDVMRVSQNSVIVPPSNAGGGKVPLMNILKMNADHQDRNDIL
jgi:hypothetical protein